MSKYGNVPTFIDGLRFDSKAEAKRYGELRILQFDRQILELKRQPSFPLLGKNGTEICRYRADFSYTEAGRTVVEDVKGAETKDFKLKRRLFEDNYPEIEFRIVRV